MMWPEVLKEENISPCSPRSTRSHETMGHLLKCPVTVGSLLLREAMETLPGEL